MASKSTGPIQRKEEVLEVGLARHQKRKSNVPWWLVEYGGWIAVGAVLLFVVLPFSILGFSSGTNQSSAPVAQLYMISRPMKVWGEGATNQLKSVAARIANRGLVTAEQVVVKAIINEEEYPLSGPQTIKSGKVEVFSGTVDKRVPADAQIAVSMACATCQ